MSNAIVTPLPGFYQVAYVTADFDRALSAFEKTHGIKRFLEMRDLHYQTGPDRKAHCNIALAYVGGVEIEVINPLGGDVQLYRDFLPAEGGVRFHHIAKLFDTEDEFERHLESLRQEGRRLPIIGSNQGVARYFYGDYRAELGHYLEFIYFSPPGREFLATIPRN